MNLVISVTNNQQQNMNKSGIPLFKLFGFKVSLDYTWFFLAILVAWTLAAGYFPLHYKGLSVSTYWLMGIVGAIGLFLSIVLHELSHSVVGRHYDLPIAGIKLFIFGGIAEMRDEPPSPKSEFLMAVAGPIMSIALGIVFYALFFIGLQNEWPVQINGVIGYLGMINFLLAIFNLFPGFPLDGGRILRAILWWWKNDIKWATQVASWFGRAMGFALILLGILIAFTGNIIGALWLVLIGFFIQYIAKMSYQQLIIKQTLSGKPIKTFITNEPISVPGNLTLDELVDQYFYRYYHKLYPVMERDKLIGSISLNEIRQVPKEQWATVKVNEVMQVCSKDNTISADTEVTQALQKMTADGINRIMVVESGSLCGIITLKDLMNVISIKVGLGD
jgi:Zn-dependent protease/CBS domain-containing protein